MRFGVRSVGACASQAWRTHAQDVVRVAHGAQPLRAGLWGGGRVAAGNGTQAHEWSGYSIWLCSGRQAAYFQGCRVLRAITNQYSSQHRGGSTVVQKNFHPQTYFYFFLSAERPPLTHTHTHTHTHLSHCTRRQLWYQCVKVAENWAPLPSHRVRRVQHLSAPTDVLVFNMAASLIATSPKRVSTLISVLVDGN